MDNKISILIVDDDKAYIEFLTVLAERSNYTVKTSGSAEETLAHFKKNMFKIAVLDLGLPGVHGVDLCIKLRKIDKKIKIFALTGYSKVFDEIPPCVAGFDGVYSKDKLTDLLDEIDGILK